ncbi:hypothetical protein [Amycolatopsis japonica]
MTEIDREAVLQAARAQAWDEGKKCEHCKGAGELPGGRKLIHTFRGGFGADWDLSAVEEFIGKADRVEEGRGLFGPPLVVATVGAEQVAFEINTKLPVGGA